MITCRTAERAALPLGRVPIPIHKLLIPLCPHIFFHVLSWHSFGDYYQSFYLGLSLLVVESLNFHCLCDTNRQRISSKAVFLQGTCCALWLISETLTLQAQAHTLLLWESPEDHFTYLHTNKSCCPKMFWAVGKILMDLSGLSQALWETCAFLWRQLGLSSALLGKHKWTEIRQHNWVLGLYFLPSGALNGIFQFEPAESFLAMLPQAEFYCLAG